MTTCIEHNVQPTSARLAVDLRLKGRLACLCDVDTGWKGGGACRCSRLLLLVLCSLGLAREHDRGETG